MPTIVIAAGGTAGHVVPALAVAAALRDSGARVEFVGGERAEAELVPAAGFPFHPLRGGGHRPPQPAEGRAGRVPRRRGDAVRAAAAEATGRRRRHGRRRLRGRPVGLAARSLGLPVVATEADSHLGITNRLLARFARDRVPGLPDRGPRGRALPRGGPPAARGHRAADRDAARRQFGIEPGQTCLLVFGGSLGARRINQATIDAFGSGAPGDVLHASGRRDHDELAARLDELGSPPHYHLHAYIDPFADALAAADLVVARSGGSVLEVAAAGLPSVLVPYPHATADHQTRTRATWSARAPPWWCPTTSWTARGWRARWRALLGSPDRMAAMGRAAAEMARPDAARVVADELLALSCASRRWARRRPAPGTGPAAPGRGRRRMRRRVNLPTLARPVTRISMIAPAR